MCVIISIIRHCNLVYCVLLGIIIHGLFLINHEENKVVVVYFVLRCHDEPSHRIIVIFVY